MARTPDTKRLALLPALLACVTFADACLAREPIVSGRYFAFYNDFDTNLNDALTAASNDRRFDREELFHAGPEQACFEALAPSQQAGWNLAVSYYADIVSPHEFNDRPQMLLRLHFAELDESPDERARDFIALAKHFMAAAAPAYLACSWPAPATRNRNWADRLATSLEAHGAALARRLAALYMDSWPGEPMDVDVVGTVSWAGANSVFSDDIPGHILVASSFGDREALEIAFHEASHRFMLPGKPLPNELAAAAERQGETVPDGLWHVLLFETTGDTVRKVLEEAGETGYEPMITEIYSRSPWARYRDAVEAVWPAYLDGETSASDAMSMLLDRVYATNE